MSSEPCATCDFGSVTELRLTFTTDEGATWAMVVTAQDALEQLRASVEALIGEELSLRARYRMRFQNPISIGFVLSDATGIVMAAETGPWVESLEPGDLSALEVTLGADVCREVASTCGNLVLSELVFQGDESVSVGFATDEEFRLGGLGYTARNLGGGRLLPGGCTDQEHVSTWAIWRNP